MEEGLEETTALQQRVKEAGTKVEVIWRSQFRHNIHLLFDSMYRDFNYHYFARTSLKTLATAVPFLPSSPSW